MTWGGGGGGAETIIIYDKMCVSSFRNLLNSISALFMNRHS